MFRRLWTVFRADILCFAVLAAVLPFSVAVQSAEPAGSDGKEAPPTSNDANAKEKANQGPRNYSFTEIEELLEEVRKKRQNDPMATHDLIGWYGRMARPQFTGSKDIPEHCSKLADWRKQLPKSPTPLVALAKAHINYAWEARGSGFANTVTKEGWELFHTRIDEAHRLLDEAVKIGVKDGEAYRSLIEVAKVEGLSKDQARAFLDQGMKIDARYVEMYTGMAQYLLPRWHGEPGDVEKFASEMAEKVGGDDGLEACAMIAFVVNKFDGQLVFWGEYDHDLLVRAGEVLVKRYPKSRPHVHFAALCSLIAQNREAAQRIRPFVGDFNEDDCVWPWQNTYADYLTWCDAKVIPAGEEAWVWGADKGCMGIAFAPNPRFVWCAQQFDPASAFLLDISTKQIRMSLPHPGGVVNGFAFDAAKRWVVVSSWDGPLVGWTLIDLKDPQSNVVQRTAEKIDEAAINPRFPIVAWTARSNDVHLREIKDSGKVIDIALPSPCHGLKFSPDGTLLAVGTRHGAVYDVASGELKYELANEESTPKPELLCRLILDIDDQGRVWATASEAAGSRGKTRLVRYYPDGTSYDVLIQELAPGPKRLSSNRRLLATAVSVKNGAASSGIDIWDVSSARIVKHLDGHWNSAYELAFSFDGKKLASIASDGVVKVWSLEASTGNQRD